MGNERRTIVSTRTVVAFCLVLVAAFLLWHTFDEYYSQRFIRIVDHALVLPRVLLVLCLALATVALVQDALGRRAARAEAQVPRPGVYAVILALILSAALMPHIGFVLAITPLVATVMIAIGERRWMVCTLMTVLIGPGLWFLFHHILLIRLPSVLSGGAL